MHGLMTTADYTPSRCMPNALVSALYTQHGDMHGGYNLAILSQLFYAGLSLFPTKLSLGPFYGAIAVPSVTRCRWRCRGHMQQ